METTKVKNYVGVSSGRKKENGVKFKKLLLIFAVILLIAVSAGVLSACNGSAITEGTIVFKDYCQPIYSSSGIFDFRMQGGPDYYIKIENNNVFQWYRVTDLDYYASLRVGDYITFDPSKLKAVNSVFG